MAIIDGSDVSFLNTTLAQIGSWTEQPGTVFVFAAVTSGGTSEEAGVPSAVTYGTRAASVRIETVSMTEVEKSRGKYYQNDKRLSVRGSWSPDDMIGCSGTFKMVDGPWKIYMGSNLFWQGIGREVKS